MKLSACTRRPHICPHRAAIISAEQQLFQTGPWSFYSQIHIYNHKFRAEVQALHILYIYILFSFILFFVIFFKRLVKAAGVCCLGGRLSCKVLWEILDIPPASKVS